MGSGAGSDLAHRPVRRRHRQPSDTGAGTDTGTGTGTAGTGRHRRPEIGPGDPPPPDPLCDTGSTGLRMFNLGTIPASVTPPRSWRRAAWFTVIASIAALAGLLVMGALLVGPARNTGRITALPYFPEGKPLAALRGDSTTGSPAARPGPVTSDSASATRAGTGTDRAATTTTGTHQPTGRPATSAPGRPTPTRHPSPPVAGTLPVIPPVTTGGDPVVDPTKLIKRTRTFFAEVTSDAQAAADLTTGTVHDDAVALIRQRYGDLSAIRIQRMSLDPSNGLTVCLVRVTARDGDTETRRITLRFTPGGDPKIINPGG
jgi:hypothetical protein